MKLAKIDITGPQWVGTSTIQLISTTFPFAAGPQIFRRRISWMKDHVVPLSAKINISKDIFVEVQIFWILERDYQIVIRQESEKWNFIYFLCEADAGYYLAMTMTNFLTKNWQSSKGSLKQGYPPERFCEAGQYCKEIELTSSGRASEAQREPTRRTHAPHRPSCAI